MKFVKRWLEKAKNDIKAAKILISSNDHDIADLLKLCVKEDSDFASLETEKLEALTFYAVEVRYPDEFYIEKTGRKTR